MPKMTLFWFLTYCSGLLLSFVNPFYGTLTYLFEYYLRPSLHWWGKQLPDLRWNFAIAGVLGATYLLRRGSLATLPKARRGPAICLLALLGVMLLVNLSAVNPALSWIRTTDYLKLIFFHGAIVGTVRTEWAFDAFVGLHMAGAGWWGWQAYVDPKREAGRLANIGSGDTLGDNFAAAHLLTVIPFIVVYLLVHKDKRLRGLAFLVAPFVINAFILCNSRGSVVALLAAAATAMWVTKAGHRLRTIGAALLFAAGLYALADPQFIARQQSTTRYEEDGSSMGRLESWRGGVQLIRDYPFGAGGGGYPALSEIYIPDVVARHGGQQRDPHNTFVLVPSEWGLLGLLLFVGYYLSCLRLLRDVRRRAPEGGIWYYRGVAVQVSLIGLFVASTFSDRLYAEAPYWMGALAVALHRLQTHKLAQEQEKSTQPERHPAEAVGGWPMRPAAARIAAGPLARALDTKASP